MIGGAETFGPEWSRSGVVEVASARRLRKASELGSDDCLFPL